MARRRQFHPRTQRSFRRKIATRTLRERFLIVCEGEKTEPNYFRRFRVPKDVVDLDIRGIGANTSSLVQEAINLRNKEIYDQVWCVFDRDSFPADNFNSALALATANDISVAYSNEAFELWYLLHFHYYQTGITRASYIEKLSKLLQFKYEKNSEHMYDLLESKQPIAIRNAEKLLQEYSEFTPEKNNPSTTVHLLIKELNRFVV